jgi:hypothetical protein
LVADAAGRRRSAASGLPCHPAEPAAHCSRSHVRTCDPDTETTEAAEIARLLEEYRIKRVPVVHDDRIVGIVSRADLLRTNHRNIHVRGYKEEGTTTTPFDMVVRNDLDRFHLASDVIDRVPKLGYMAAYAKQAMRDKLIEHKQYITRYGDDMPEVKDWRWPAARA